MNKSSVTCQRVGAAQSWATRWENGAINQSCTSQLPTVFMLQFLLISSCFAHSSLSTFQRLFPSRTLTIIVFPSSTAERADRERERKWVRKISSTAVPWPPGLSGHTVGVIYSKVYLFHGDKMKTNQALTKWESNILKPSQSAWGVFLLSDRLFGKTDKHWTYCLTVCLCVFLSVCLSVYHICQSHI